MEHYEIRQKRAIYIQAMRTKAGLSRREYAIRVGVSEKTIQNWETGLSVPDMEQLEALAVAAHCDPAVYLEVYRNPVMIAPDGGDGTKMLLHKWLDNAADCRMAAILAFLHLTGTGSDKAAQLELFCAYNQLPLYDRQNIARSIVHCYQIAQERGELAAADACQPDLEKVMEAISSGVQAVKEGKTAYK